MLRRIIAVLLGVVGGGMVVSFLQKMVIDRYPMPEDAQLMSKDAYFDFIENLPTEAFLLILNSHCLGALLAAIIASALASSTKRYMGYIAGFVILIFIVVTLAALPQPKWMYLADPIAVILAILLGGAIGSRLGKKA